MNVKRLIRSPRSSRRVLNHDEVERILNEHTDELRNMAKRVRVLEIEAGIYKLEDSTPK